MAETDAKISLAKHNRCNCGIFHPDCLQRFANPTAYVILYGIVGCVLSMTNAYFSATITSLEKRFHMPTRNVGFISTGNNISQMLVPAVLGYYAGRGHRPRWIGVGLLSVVLFCLLSQAPHWIYGPGEEALALTVEYGPRAASNVNSTSMSYEGGHLCRWKDEKDECPTPKDSELLPQLLLFIGQLLAGIGGALFYTLGVSYLDDHTERSRVPALLSLSFFMNMVGPSFGFGLASLCLRLFVAPHLHPHVTSNDPRWLGAWWLGWMVLAGVLLPPSIALMMFPRELPRQRIAESALADEEKLLPKLDEEPAEALPKPSLHDMLHTFRRLLGNKTFMCSNLSSIFYFFGYTPYWIFTSKYIEIQFRTSAATANLATGSTAFVFTALGVLLSGCIISRLRPSARSLAAWNVTVSTLTVVGMVAYVFIGCAANEEAPPVNSLACNVPCRCEFVPYAPVCGSDGHTYVSACHAGCRQEGPDVNGKQIFSDCLCVGAVSNTTSHFVNIFSESGVQSSTAGGSASFGPCPVDCRRPFLTFLAIMSALKLLGASSRTSNLLVSMRCIPEQDKTAAMGLGMMLISLFTFIPSPIVFGWLIDSVCLVWGRRSCGRWGNCWLYDARLLRRTMNLTAAGFVMVGVVFDCGVWHRVRDLHIFELPRQKFAAADATRRQCDEEQREEMTLYEYRRRPDGDQDSDS